MNIKKFFTKEKSVKNLLNTIGNRFDFFGDNNKKELLKQYKGWVYRCVDIVSNEVAAVDINLYSGNKEVENHDILTLLDRVNPVMSRTDLIKATQSFLCLQGDAFWYLSRDNVGKIQEIWPLRPDWMTIKVNKDAEIESYVYGTGTKKTEYDKASIIPFINFNPKFFNEKRPFRGIGDVEASLATIYENEYISKWNSNLLKNGARIDGVLEYDGELNEEDYKLLEDKWNQSFSGANNTGKTAILTAGLKYNKIGIDHGALDFINQKKLNRDDIFLILGVPKGLMIADDVNRANAQAALYPFLRFTIKPKVLKIVDTLNEFLLPEIGGENLKFKFDDIIPEDKEAKLAEQDKAVNRWMTINEVREDNGMDPIDNGNKLYIPFNLMELGAEPEQEDKKEEKKDFVVKIKENKSAYEKLSTGQQKKINNYLITGKKFESKYKKEVNKWFDKLEKKALELVGTENKGITKSVDDIFAPLKEYAKKYFGIFLPINKTIFLLSGNDAFDDLDLDQEFNENTERIKKQLEKMTKKAGDAITTETIEKLSGKMAQQIEDGASISDIRTTVKDYFVYSTTKRADRIARTEVFRALNQGKLEAWKQSNVVAKKEWVTMKDELTCPFCSSMDGKIIDLGKSYFNKNDILSAGGQDLSFNYGDITMGNLHVNCRCTCVPIVSTKAIKEDNFNDILETINEI